jgi:hypothetical protein
MRGVKKISFFLRELTESQISVLYSQSLCIAPYAAMTTPR